MLQNMKNASATEPAPLTIDGHPAMQDELSGMENGTDVVFLHTTVDDGDYFQPRTLSGDTQVALETTPNAFGATRNYQNFSQREIAVIQIQRRKWTEMGQSTGDRQNQRLCWPKCSAFLLPRSGR
jgi:hypothetical protein